MDGLESYCHRMLSRKEAAWVPVNRACVLISDDTSDGRSQL